jgi:hypothetical protein
MNECPHGLFDVCCTNYDNCSIGEPKKEWQGLTDDELSKTIDDVIGFNSCVGWEADFARVIEAKLKDKNNG